MKFLSDIEVEEGLRDKDGGLGADGQILSSTGSLTSWIDAASGSIGGSIADNQIAVGASTANTIEGSDNFRLIPLTLGSVAVGRLVVQGRLEISDQIGFGAANLFIGSGAGSTAWSGANLGIGGGALGSSAGGELNCAVGYEALSNSTLGDRNTALGQSSLFFMTGTGQDDNIAIGAGAAQYYSTGTGQLTQSSQGVYIGSATRASANNISNEIVIGYSAVGGGSDTITLGNSSIDTFRIPGLGNTNGHVLTYSTADDGFILAAGGGGGGIGGATVTNQVAFGSATASEITSDSTFTFIKTGTGSSANTLLEVGDGDSSDDTSKGSVFITAKQVDDSTSRARFQLYSESNLRGYLQCSGTSTDVTLYSNKNLVLDCGSTEDITMASSSSSGVGIGTTTPSKKLTVNGTIYSEQASGEVMIAGDGSFETKFITIREGNNPAAQWGLQKGTTTPDTGIQPSGSVMLMRSSKDMAFRSNLAKNTTSFQNVGSSHLSIVSPTGFDNSAANVGIGTDTPKSKLQVNGGVQIADDTDSASADKVGTFKYYTDSPAGIYDYSYVDMCMQTDTATYEWVNVVTNRWVG